MRIQFSVLVSDNCSDKKKILTPGGRGLETEGRNLPEVDNGGGI